MRQFFPELKARKSGIPVFAWEEAYLFYTHSKESFEKHEREKAFLPLAQ